MFFAPGVDDFWIGVFIWAFALASGLLDEGQNLDIRVGDRTWRQAFCVIWKCVYVHLCGGSILVLENLNDSFPLGAHRFAVI